jgi:hypothetical protein
VGREQPSRPIPFSRAPQDAAVPRSQPTRNVTPDASGARRAALNADGQLDLLGDGVYAQSETVVPSRAERATAPTTERDRTPSAAGTGFGARPAHVSRNA